MKFHLQFKSAQFTLAAFLFFSLLVSACGNNSKPAAPTPPPPPQGNPNGQPPPGGYTGGPQPGGYSGSNCSCSPNPYGCTIICQSADGSWYYASYSSYSYSSSSSW